MRLLKLALQNWRGVDAREVCFTTGVTLIEGPNEVGKSTIVEALRMLFNEMDSSNKKSVKAIQPVGQDVGSRVEAEVQAGKHHFVYAKTYNKSRQTTLDILSPAALQAQCDRYLRQRDSTAVMPGSAAESRSRMNEARSALASCQDELEVVQEQAQSLQVEHDQHDARLRHAQQQLAGLRAALEDKRERLQKERTLRADDALAEHARRAGAKVEALLVAAAALQASLDGASPEAAQALLGNAIDTLERTSKDLKVAEQDLAVLSDRLQHAQADGRFDALESARHNFETTRAILQSIRRRGDSAALLWKTLNKHRNTAREAYVQPLKEAIERLGAIVFGPGFAISIGDDWSIISRTLHGKTLLFGDLSVGAREQLGILARLAAAQLVSKQGGVPLIIDDALGFADPARLDTMGAAIAAAGKHCQIVILTCTPGRFTNVGSAEVVRFRHGSTEAPNTTRLSR